MNNPILKPERFSGHKLVDYLIANPQAQGNFKWHTLRSCMWTRLLVQCPQFASRCDFGRITRQCSVAQSFLTLSTPWAIACQSPLSMEFPRQE